MNVMDMQAWVDWGLWVFYSFFLPSLSSITNNPWRPFLPSLYYYSYWIEHIFWFSGFLIIFSWLYFSFTCLLCGFVAVTIPCYVMFARSGLARRWFVRLRYSIVVSMELRVSLFLLCPLRLDGYALVGRFLA